MHTDKSILIYTNIGIDTNTDINIGAILVVNTLGMDTHTHTCANQLSNSAASTYGKSENTFH